MILVSTSLNEENPSDSTQSLKLGGNLAKALIMIIIVYARININNET